jgi:hypothetical protein
LHASDFSKARSLLGNRIPSWSILGARHHNGTSLRECARRSTKIARTFEPVQDGRIYIEKINGLSLYELKGMPAEYKARSGLCDRNGLAGAARERHVCPLHGCWRSAICVINWSRAFDDPKTLPDGGQLRTPRDAGVYVTTLSKADQGK